MKKVVFLFATITMFMHSQAQTKITKERSRVLLAQGMASFTTSVRPAYRSGQTYAAFEKALLGKAKITQQGRILLKKAYGYVANGTSSLSIASKDSGSEMALALATMESLKQGDRKAAGGELFGLTTGGVNPYPEAINSECRGWWDLFCHLKNLILFVSENQGTICFISGFFGHPCPQSPASTATFTF